MITITQFDGQYTLADVAKMNAAVADILAHHRFSDADLTDRQRAEITAAVQHEVTGRWDDGSLDPDTCMPAGWARLIRANLP